MVNFIEKLRAARVVPVIRHSNPDIAMAACELLVGAGIKALEVTTTVPRADTLIADLRQRFPDICTGAGTVFTAAQAHDVLAAGAEFVVSPCWSETAAPVILDAGIPYLPGAMTPGEVHHHAENGASVVKVFPADAAGGPGFLKALKSVFPDLALMPTGGVSPENATAYLNAGAVCVGMGGKLLPARALEANDLPLAREQINTAIAAVSIH
ncbi:bifunctional 4-hydroxy-2-oxoglutarate aldolase/2-dehydro-3-deoxy-phosphogluconate aldolase [Shimia abyssi]|uniref:2-dehydro-3-deoxyphosphogluconate aldolase/(4S)-4-hydroxy-2-oxoglutarate aldolase n=1 Tax=Shimia abyssi TaxID=1662395 RepID=A0A2P8FHD8_9RHOB|nr:bifunctional 4-hydroxy-2-oxoglutarate aldolase/2-dehydro-3-deoxy-phosphogluconate aldolase [Shimia abyssi]PSL21152.1 2-dehydro-3-deoxyphosphogluconate aldolase/(4S)-4-hydroxy-2-oxoglutarate aldolase [Shimia abyssi]